MFTPRDNNSIKTKIVVVGDSSVGKSSMLRKYIFPNENIDSIKPTIGIDFMKKEIKTENRKITFQIWDTAGMEKYQSLDSVYYRNSGYIIYVYDITNEKTFSNLLYWLRREEKIITGDDIKPLRILVGNKTDLNKQQIVDDFKVQKFANENRFDYFIKTSAVTGYNLDKLFSIMAENIIKKLDMMNFEEKRKKQSDEYDFKGIEIIELTEEKFDIFKQNKKTNCCFI